MKRFGRGIDGCGSQVAWRAIALSCSLLAVAGCNSAPVAVPAPMAPAAILPVGRLTQASAAAPIIFTTLTSWTVEIAGGTVTVKPPTSTGANLQYTARGNRDLLGTQDLRAWAGDRRTVLLPGGAKLTMRGTASQLQSIALYDGDESHEVNVATQTILHSQISASIATTRDTGEFDGESGHLILRPGSTARDVYMFLANLYTQGANADGSVRERVNAVQALGQQSAAQVTAFPDVTPALPAEFDTTCVADGVPRGGLMRVADGSLVYTTRSAQWRITIQNLHVIVERLATPISQVSEFWGHEYLNGKHIKDFDGTFRTILLADGTKVTMEQDPVSKEVKTTNIYDMAQSHEITNIGNVVRHSCVNAATATQRDAAQADGETAVLWNLRAPAAATGYSLYENVYLEQAGTSGPFTRTYTPYLLGETGDPVTNPSQVIDYYDDPRLAAT
jgi:hypothetical protein